MLMSETVTLQRTPTEPIDYDMYGNPIYGEPVSTDSPAWIEPMTSREASDRQIQQTYGYVMYLPLDADVSGADVILYAGKEYEVIGEPQHQPGGFIVEGYQRVIVERTDG